MLKRKKDDVANFFRTHSIITKYKELNNLYINNNFRQLSSVWGDKIQKLNIVMKKLISARGTNDLSGYKSLLSRYFEVYNFIPTQEEEDCAVVIDELRELEAKNDSMLNNIRIPSAVSDFNDDLWMILSLVMKF